MPAEDAYLALRVVPMPRDTNPYGTIFGGVILSYIDQAGFVHALRHGAHRWVTASIERVDFKHPVHLGDIVTLWTRTARTGTKSVTIEVTVLTESTKVPPETNPEHARDPVEVTTATITMVSIGPDGRPIPFQSPPTIAR